MVLKALPSYVDVSNFKIKDVDKIFEKQFLDVFYKYFLAHVWFGVLMFK